MRRNLYDCELEESVCLLNRLNTFNPVNSIKDSWFWTIGRKGKFIVKSFIRFWMALWGIRFTKKLFGGQWSPLRWLFFSLWLVYLDRILTLDNFNISGWSLTNTYSPYFIEEESVAHLFVHCLVVQKAWNWVLSCFGVYWVFPFSFNNNLQLDSRRFKGHPQRYLESPSSDYWESLKGK